MIAKRKHLTVVSAVNRHCKDGAHFMPPWGGTGVVTLRLQALPRYDFVT